MSAMSRFVKDDGEIDYLALGNFIIEYEKKLEGWEDNLRLDKKMIADALVEHHGWAAYYDQVRADLEIAVAYFDIMLDKRAEEIYTSVRQQSGISHTESSLKRLISGNSRYIKLRRVRLELVDLKEQAKVVSEQFYQRSFTLKNYLKLIELEAQDVMMSL